MVDEAFYRPTNDPHTWESTPATHGPWSPDAQHGGPPSALVGRALVAACPIEGAVLGRLAVELLRPVPIRPLTVRAHVVRPGRRVCHLSATLTVDGVEHLRAAAWFVRRLGTAEAVDVPDIADADGGQSSAPPAPETLPDSIAHGAWAQLSRSGYLAAMQWRFICGSFAERGPAAVWARPRIALVAGTTTTPLDAAFLLADSAGGIAANLDLRSHTFINTDVTVNLVRPPTGEWISLAAETLTWSGGLGLCRGNLRDTQGPLGSVAQTQIVERRTTG